MTLMNEIRNEYATETVRWLEDVAGWMGDTDPDPEDGRAVMMICHALERGYERMQARTPDSTESRAVWLLRVCGYRPRRDTLNGDPIRTPPRL